MGRRLIVVAAQIVCAMRLPPDVLVFENVAGMFEDRDGKPDIAAEWSEARELLEKAPRNRTTPASRFTVCYGT